MNLTQIENNLQQLKTPFNRDSFIFDFLLAYGLPKASISRLQHGGMNLTKNEGEILWKKKLFFKVITEGDVHEQIDVAKNDEKNTKYDPRFIIVTDFETLLAIDRKTTDTLDIPITDIARHFDFFLPIAGMEKAQHQTENPADVRAAERMAKLYDEILKDNPTETHEAVHSLNVFLSRLLFCFFAEDTGIFDDGLFTNSIASHTQDDGSDLQEYLHKLYDVLNTDYPDRQSVSGVELPTYLAAFPYVNGGLFRTKHPVPVFTRRSRQLMIECGSLTWRDINPDIFGSMIQAVITPEHRGGLGMHYTSVPNIMKVIEPLFLNELYEEFEAARGSNKKQNALLQRIWKIKLFDPACGSGNFLIIAYKELRRLEMKIFKEIDRVDQFHSNQFSGILLSNFYGIELDDFAHEVATLSLWLAEHQMNREFFAAFGRTKPALPLKETGNIVHGNACRIDWEQVCPKCEEDEVYVLGNPPYLGSYLQSKEQKEDLAFVANGFSSYKDMDYIACWFIQGAKFIEGHCAEFAFVTTNSICQGEQVILLWPYIFSKNLEISFAFQSFKWINNAKDNAGVYCSIIGVSIKKNKKKKIYTDSLSQSVENISPYLLSGSNTIVAKRMKPISNIPVMNYGSKIVDNGHLIFSTEEKNELLIKFPKTEKLFKKLAGSAEFIRGLERWCLYISDNNLEFANTIPPIVKRLELVKDFRSKSTESSTREMALKPHKFYYSLHNNSSSIIIPRHSSERRTYIPLGFLDGNTVVSDAASVVFNAEAWMFSILTSQIHMTWVRAVAGRLKTDYRYSSQLCYNTFPFPPISEAQKQELEQHVYRILEEREQHSEKTLAQLYDPDKMPEGLREAHHQNDLAVERCYRSRPFESDEERLEYLFKLYEQMIEEEKNRGTLFASEPKTKKKRKKE